MKLGVLAIALCPAVASADSATDVDAKLAYFVGDWSCNGSFPSTGKSIASTIHFERAPAIHGLLKQHADKPPDVYSAIELWNYSATDKRFNAAIADNFGGVRDFTSPGWVGDTIVWTSAAQVSPIQQFVYTKLDDKALRVDWKTSKTGKDFVVGDTLTCKRK